MEQKASYEVFKYLDTQYSFEVANKYLSSIKFRKEGTVYSVANGNITSYDTLMDLCDSGYVCHTQCIGDKIIVRSVSPSPQID